MSADLSHAGKSLFGPKFSHNSKKDSEMFLPREAVSQSEPDGWTDGCLPVMCLGKKAVMTWLEWDLFVSILVGRRGGGVCLNHLSYTNEIALPSLSRNSLPHIVLSGQITPFTQSSEFFDHLWNGSFLSELGLVLSQATCF